MNSLHIANISLCPIQGQKNKVPFVYDFRGSTLSFVFPWWLSSKESACQCGRHGLDAWVRNSPWRRKRQRTPVSLPGEFHGQRNLVDYSPWGGTSRTRRATNTFLTPTTSQTKGHFLTPLYSSTHLAALINT